MTTLKTMTTRTHWTKRVSNQLEIGQMKRSPFAAAILLGLVTGVSAQNPASTPRPESATSAPAAELSSTNRAFITKAAEGGKAGSNSGSLPAESLHG